MKQQYTFRSTLLLILASSLFLWGCFDNSLTFKVLFQEVSGLKQENGVYLGKNEIGRVEKVTYTDQGEYLVEVKIAPEFKNAATEDSRFYIGHSPAGDNSMAVLVEQEQPGGTILQNGVTVKGSTRFAYLNQIVSELKKRAEVAGKEVNTSWQDMKKSFDGTSEELDRKLESALDDVSRQLEKYRNDVKSYKDSRQARQFEESLRQLADNFQKAQQNVQDYFREEILPQLRLQLERLREQLQQEGREDELEKIDAQMKRLEC